MLFKILTNSIKIGTVLATLSHSLFNCVCHDVTPPAEDLLPPPPPRPSALARMVQVYRPRDQ